MSAKYCFGTKSYFRVLKKAQPHPLNPEYTNNLIFETLFFSNYSEGIKQVIIFTDMRVFLAPGARENLSNLQRLSLIYNACTI